MTLFDKIYKIVSLIPEGRVLTYKEVATLSKINNPRIIGFALHKNRNPEKIPCHRVVRADGALAKGYAFGGLEAQKELLKREGIMFRGNKINLKKFFYNFTS